jgi:predicted 2-oxoglutarate/Fe(II)-dependent dioxygenase YbiX
MVKSVDDQNAWSAAAIGEESGESYGSAVRTEYRAAYAYTPPIGSNIRKQFDQKIRTVIRPLVRQVWGRDFKRHEDTHLVRYSPGGFYVSHADAGLDLNNRYFTVLCYLNDSFVGGQTSFPTLSFAFTPQIGKAIVFPATYIHRAEPVLKGRKYVLVSWLIAADPIRWI